MSDFYQFREKEYKDKWLRKFQKDIDYRKRVEANEKIKNLTEEKNYLQKLKSQEDQLSIRKIIGKINIIKAKNDNIQLFNEKKKDLVQKKINDKFIEKGLNGLDLKSDERINDFKIYMQKLEDRVDRNFENTKNYLTNISQPNINNQYLVLNEANRISNEGFNNNEIKIANMDYSDVIVNNERNYKSNINNYEILNSSSYDISDEKKLKSPNIYNRNLKQEQQRMYKNLLDNQIKENIIINQLQRNKSTHNLEHNSLIDQKLIYGYQRLSSLEINPIIKSNSNYNNKYIQNQFQESPIHSCLKQAGNQIMKK